jgi:4-amino-4-deoxy-L-arabinose transferase-like glycosyltransferase
MPRPAISIDNITGLKLLWLLSVLAAFFYNIQGFPLFDLDEGAFSQATREMMLGDNYLTTYLNGEPRFDKPILTYWLQAFSVSLFGVNELAFRLPSAVAAALWNLLIVAFTWRLASPRAALIAGILMAGALGTGLIGKAATADALLNLFLSAALFSGYLHLKTESTAYLFAAALFIGLGFLTKGPIAVLIPVAVTLLYALSSGRLRQWGRMAVNPTAWLIFLSVGFPWYLVNYLREGPDFIEAFIGIHNIGRFNQAMEGHTGPWWYYLPVILLLTFPFGFLILQPLRHIRRLFSSELDRFLLIWFLFVLGFFSLAATKLPHYLLYGLTPLFVLSAIHLPDKADRRWTLMPLLSFMLFLLVFPYLAAYLSTALGELPIAETLRRPDTYLPDHYYLILTLLLATTLWLWLAAGDSTRGWLLSAGLLSTFMVSRLVLPMIGHLQQEPIREAARIAAHQQRPAVMWRLNNPSFSVYLGRITPRRKPEAGEMVLTKSHLLARLPPHRTLYQRQGIVLAVVDPAGPEIRKSSDPQSTAVSRSSHTDTVYLPRSKQTGECPDRAAGSSAPMTSASVAANADPCRRDG